jgi:hypothetical protein
VDVEAYKRRNRAKKLKERLAHPWPLYKKTGGISAVVIRANGDREDLGDVAVTYVRRSMFKVETNS